jgi:hypothetical protein
MIAVLPVEQRKREFPQRRKVAPEGIAEGASSGPIHTRAAETLRQKDRAGTALWKVAAHGRTRRCAQHLTVHAQTHLTVHEVRPPKGQSRGSAHAPLLE